MKTSLALSALVALMVPGVSQAAQMCPERTPAAITKVAEGSLKCQQTITKEGSKFVKTKMKELSKCRLKEPTGTCPTIKNVEKILKAASKAEAKITKSCGEEGAEVGLTSSYNAHTDDGLIAQCLLSQHNVEGEVLVGLFTGIATENAFVDVDAKARENCVKELSKLGQKYVMKTHKTVTKCIDQAMKDGVMGDLAPLCVGRYSGGVFIPPTDVKAAEGLAKLVGKAEEAVAKKCNDPLGNIDPDFGYIQTIFACPDAGNTNDLKKCIVCEGWDGVLDLVEQEYSESFQAVVTPGADAIQTAVDAASAGDKLFIRSGDYNEDVTISTNGLKLVGCGGASNERPRVIRSQGESRGLQATGVDGLLFQSLDLFGWEDDGIFVASANGVSFRDIVGDGNLASAYLVFPVTSSNVLIEACDVTRVDDAALYVGQSSDITVRFNKVTASVAGIEIENSANASVHNNLSTGNTGGLLVFKLPGLTVQDSMNHRVFANVSQGNNVPNFGNGFVGNVPRGTGMMVISTDDSIIRANIIRNNDQYGLLLLDQIIINALIGNFCDGGDNDGDPCTAASQCTGGGTCEPTFPTLSPDQNCHNNLMVRNHTLNNAANPDPGSPLTANIVFVLGDTQGGDHDNCFTPRTSAQPEALGTPEDCTP